MPPRLSHRSAIFPPYPHRVNPSIRPLRTTPIRYLKEDAHRSGHEIEAKKQEQLKKQDKGEGHWHEELGSQSESHVKADRQNVDDHGEHMEELQQHTKNASEEGKLQK
ncbi:hypothetical protein AOQ84DRAFT_355579 [Glonium stellatum]|uniref:Uncharacterized protein n=1 Tax=Glonium stellatum TaxID=574774 RepID=A0A8E2EX96_9PEZI|nr:hypothetical protein AOQ84DRAFT_355579 [Glonium stellatum]